MLIFGGLLIIIIIGSVSLAVLLHKKRIKIFSLPFILTLILTIITPGIIITYFLIGLTCMGGCYVNKHTPTWFFTMELSAIGNLPVIQPINEAQYYYDTDLGERWEVTYESKSQLHKIQTEIESYLINKKVQLNSRSSCSNGYWDINEKTVIMNCASNDRCIMIYLEDNKSYVLVRALEMD